MRLTNVLRLFLFLPLLFVVSRTIAQELTNENSDSLIGPHVQLRSTWKGNIKASKTLSILLLAGHADSQGISGSGTAGEAVGLLGAEPMDPLITDELYWNLKVCKEVARLGKINGLNITFYDPGVRKIIDEKDPKTNWTNGFYHAMNGGYSLEIHFDAYGEYGYGPGLIPALTLNLNTIDESLARNFGRYPILFRGGLGSPRRQIRILEIGKLEGKLEQKLRDKRTSDSTINLISLRIVNSILEGVGSETISN